MWYELPVYIVSVVAGLAAALSVRRLPASGKLALVLALVPPAGLGLAMKFC
jgi:hypothetical protein